MNNQYPLGNFNYEVRDYSNPNLFRIDVSGTWVTGWNGAPVKMYLSQEGNVVTGTYDFNNGRLIGILTDNVLTGAWQSNNTGNFKFVFSPDGTSFLGSWGFNKDATGAGPWYGRKVGLKYLDVTGTWDTNYSKLFLEQKEYTVVGKYDRYNGRIEGILEDNILSGTWYEDSNNDGKYENTGKFRLTFAIDDTFKGSRGSNDSYINDGPWNGKRIDTTIVDIKHTETLNVTGEWNTNFNKMILQQTGYNVSGEFDYNNGKIIGLIHENTMTGTWYQDVNSDGTYESVGKLVFKFSLYGNSFQGTWGYIESFYNGGLWNGTKINNQWV